jgi:hypothetical protein
MADENKKNEKKEFDPNEFLNKLMEDHGSYFTDDRYRRPTSRYEAWLMASCLSNLIIAKTLEKVFDEFKDVLQGSDIFQKQLKTPIIKENEPQLSVENLKRRPREK